MSVEYASKGVAGTGLGLGIAGTALGVLAGSNNGNGLLGGLFGGNGANAQVSALQAENAMLKSENYSDKNAKEVYGQSLTDNRLLRSELYARIDPLTAAVVENAKDIATLSAEVKCNAKLAEKDQQIIAGKINEVALTTSGRFASLDQTIACITQKLDDVGSWRIKNDGISPGWGPVCTQPVPCSYGK